MQRDTIRFVAASSALLLSGVFITFAAAGGTACATAAADASAPGAALTSKESANAPAGAPGDGAGCTTGAAVQPLVELAICLDTSGSMQGLIDTARARIWDIVSDLATATPAPKLRVALVTFGNDGHNNENGWTNVDIGLTEDLDSVSLKLFALSTNGGTELVGRAVDVATRSLEWTPGESVLHLIVVAGNESADQDQTVKYADASRRAIEKGIMVNSIYCGDPNDALAPQWRDVAKLADGKFAAINQSNGAIAIATPFDDELASISSQLNTTYIPYGAKGEWHASNQTAQDANAANMAPAAAAQRCVAKSGGIYDNTRWDLVDACKNKDFKLEDVKAEDLPLAMQSMTLEQRRAFVQTQSNERETLQARVQEIAAKRAQFIAAEQAKVDANTPRFETVIRDAVRSQARAKGMEFPADPTTVAGAIQGTVPPASVPAANGQVPVPSPVQAPKQN